MLNPKQQRAPLTTATHPPFAAYQPPNLSAPRVPKVGRLGKLYLPTMAVVAGGYAAANYYQQRVEDQKLEAQRQEAERLRKMKMLEAYAARDSLESLEQAMEVYEVQ